MEIEELANLLYMRDRLRMVNSITVSFSVSTPMP